MLILYNPVQLYLNEEIMKFTESAAEKELPLHTAHTAFSLVVTCLSVVGGFQLLPEQLHFKTLSSRGAGYTATEHS